MTNSRYFKTVNKELSLLVDHKPIFKTGNKKIGFNTVIFNLTSAHNCISRKKGLCRIPKNKCYAYRDENRYKQTLAYRLNQSRYWEKCTVKQFLIDIQHINAKNKIPVKYVRFNESGDIRNIADLNKIELIAKELKRIGIYVYLYTARIDLLHELLQTKYVCINGSGFKVHNSFNVVSESEYLTKKIRCKNDCTKCSLCKQKLNSDIYTLLRS